MIKVIYHHPCSDGFCAAYLFWLSYPEVTFQPMNYGVPLALDNFNKNDEVFIVDFSFKRDIILELAEKVKNVTVLDHHKTAEAELSGKFPDNCDICFNIEQAGAMIAWNYLYPSTTPSPLVAYVQDRDLWQWKLLNSREVSAYIQTVDFDFEEWKQLDQQMLKPKKIAKKGKLILRKLNQQIKYAVANARKYTLHVPGLGNRIVKGVNATVNFSEVAGELGKGGIGITWQYVDERYRYSLRSTTVDVSEIAKAFGGGGHAQAAGFESDKLLLKVQESRLGKVIQTIFGRVYIWAHDTNCKKTFTEPNVPTGDYYICFACDEEGIKKRGHKIYISFEEMEGYFND